jgi:hypothetical protein
MIVKHIEKKAWEMSVSGWLEKSKHTQKIQILCLLFIFIGCSSQPTSTPSIATPSKTLPLSTSTSVQAVTPTSINKSNLTQNCPQFFQNLDRLEGNNYGKILFDRDSTTSTLYNKLENPYLYTLGTNEKKWIIKGAGFAVSNDGSLFAYRVVDEYKIIISNGGNGKTLSISFTQPVSVEGWVSDGFLYNYNNDETLFVNPFNNERKILQKNFPNRYSLHDTWMEGVYEKVYYDPTLTRAFYFAKDAQTNSYYFSMWDVSANKEIVRLPQIGFADSFPAEWALDGKQIIIYVSSTNGKQTVLLSIHTDGTIETLLSNANNSSRFALSPDSQYLALWLYDKNQKNWSLSVLDMKSKSITDYCLKSKYFPEMPPLWSPDNQNLVVYPSDNDENTEAILVNREQNFAVRIAENAKPIGWLK